jgi:excisionase family DNA binding protein
VCRPESRLEISIKGRDERIEEIIDHGAIHGLQKRIAEDPPVNAKTIRANGSNSEIRVDDLTGGYLLTVEQVAQLLQVPPSWVYSRTRSRSRDRIPGFRLGKYWRFRETDISNWLEAQRSSISGSK